MKIVDMSPRRAFVAASLALLIAGLLVPYGSSAQAFSILPIAQDFDPAGRSPQEALLIENTTQDQVILNLQVLTRAVGTDGREVNTETGDFTVAPKQTVLAPGQTQMVRLQWNGVATPERELAYRIVAEQRPIASQTPPKSDTPSIKIAARFVGPIYVVPVGVTPDVIVDSVRAVTDGGNNRLLEFVLHNRGRAHTLIDEPKLVVAVGGISRTLSDADLQGLGGENLLADSKRAFRVAWPEGLPFAEPKVEFNFTPAR